MESNAGNPSELSEFIIKKLVEHFDGENLLHATSNIAASKIVTAGSLNPRHLTGACSISGANPSAARFTYFAIGKKHQLDYLNSDDCCNGGAMWLHPYKMKNNYPSRFSHWGSWCQNRFGKPTIGPSLSSFELPITLRSLSPYCWDLDEDILMRANRNPSLVSHEMQMACAEISRLTEAQSHPTQLADNFHMNQEDLIKAKISLLTAVAEQPQNGHPSIWHSVCTSNSLPLAKLGTSTVALGSTGRFS